ncbi:MAG: hypothetical protein ACRBCI_11440 [Cellvibrionaceae bacterium]
MKKDQRYYWLGQDTASKQDTFFVEALDSNLWQQGSEDQWDTCWFTGMPERDTFEQLTPQKTINHIPGNNSLTIKSYLYETLMESRQHALPADQEKRYSFFPETFSMPEDYFKYQAVAAKNPQQLWIQKPRNLSRGRGIEVVKHPSAVPLDPEWIIQKYISDPHLYENHKYVLRFYVLITSVEPLRFYWYQEGFAKLASETYSEEDLDNPYRHLTNPDINEENTEAETPVTFFSFEKYRHWLQSQGHDDEALFDSLKDLITLTVIAAREKMRSQSQTVDADTQGCYELIGLDCMVDNDLKPWILECNLSPSLDTYANPDAGADDEVSIKRQLIVDLVKLLGLNEPSHQKRSLKEQTIYEQQHSGNFECLFPAKTANQYLHCFPIPRYHDISCLPDNTPVDISALNLQPNQNSEYLFEDSLAIYTQQQDGEAGHFILPNDTALWIWLKNAEGSSPNKIAEELEQVITKPKEVSIEAFRQSILIQVWDVLSDWAHAGLFDNPQDNKHQQHLSQHTDNAIKKTIEPKYIIIGSTVIILNIACATAERHLKPLFNNNQFSKTDDQDKERDEFIVNIVQSNFGYQLSSGLQIIAEHLKLSELAHEILKIFTEHSLLKNQNRDLLNMSLLKKENHYFLIADNRPNHFNDVSHQLSKEEGYTLISDSVLLDQQNGMVVPSNLPLRLSEDMLDTEEFKNSSVSTQKGNDFYTLQLQKTISDDVIHIDGIILLSEGDNNAIEKLTTAETLSACWKEIFKHNRLSPKKLAYWVNDVNGLTVQIGQQGKAADHLNKAIEEMIKDKVFSHNETSATTNEKFFI